MGKKWHQGRTMLQENRRNSNINYTYERKPSIKIESVSESCENGTSSAFPNRVPISVLLLIPSISILRNFLLFLLT